MVKAAELLALADYRRRVSEIYAGARDEKISLEDKWDYFKYHRDQLFVSHPVSALSETQKRGFIGLEYFPYDPSLRFLLDVDTNVSPDVFEIPLLDDGVMQMHRFGKIHFFVGQTAVLLSLFWINGYGGGLFLPFRDETNGKATYGGGRYLLDTIKHADLGQVQGKLVVDFNYAYNPSCAYNPRWHCPLAPHENWLSVPIRVGELAYDN